MTKKMVKVRIECDHTRIFWPNISEDPRSELTDFVNGCPTMEISQALIDEYEAAYAAMAQVTYKMEQLFRIQQNMSPLGSAFPPEHRLLNRSET